MQDTYIKPTKSVQNETSNQNVTVATHSGLFHGDDAMAVATLLCLYPEAEIVRSRDPEVLASANFRVDVGAKYCPEDGDFDHQQRGGAGHRFNNIPYAAAGLVWSHCGHNVVREIASYELDIELSLEQAEKIAGFVDDTLISVIDKADTAPDSSMPYGFSHMIAAMNPTWIESGVNIDDRFQNAVNLSYSTLVDIIKSEVSEYVAQEKAERAAADAEEGIMVLDQFLPWQGCQAVIDNCNFVVFPALGGGWMCQCVPKSIGSFDQKLPLPESWAGLRDDTIKAATGVEDSIFCHPGRFIAGASSKDGAIALAKLAKANG